MNALVAGYENFLELRFALRQGRYCLDVASSLPRDTHLGRIRHSFALFFTTACVQQFRSLFDAKLSQFVEQLFAQKS